MVTPSSATPWSRLPGVAAWTEAPTQRFEMKYLVSEETARAMRAFLRCHLRPDRFAPPSTDHAYTVHTLYLDSPDLALYRATENGDRNRFKLRVRFYAGSADAPAFFEVKRRHHESITKFRAHVHRETVHALLSGEAPRLSHLLQPDLRQLFVLQEFQRLACRLNASPRAHVTYRREAWVDPADHPVRATFDREVQCEPQFSAALLASVTEAAAVRPFQPDVIFELKFTNRLPAWCGELVRSFNLVRRSAAKYVAGVALLGEHRVSNREVGLRPAAATEERGAEAMRQGALMPAA